MNTAFPFNRQKAAESASEFIRLAGGRINVLKLTKLMYLLDRESLKKIGLPVVGGHYVSMKDGPVTSELLDSINHRNGEGRGDWEAFISERVGHEVSSERSKPCDHLSPFEKNLIRVLHEEHKNKTKYELRDWCHLHCHEWKKPTLFQPGSVPISVDALATEIQRSPAELEEAVIEAEFMADVLQMA